MRVHLPEGFCPNGNQPQTPLRATYVSVAPAVNKMLGDIVEQKLAFVLPFDSAKRYVPRMHLGKAHWTKKKGKPSGRPLGDLTFVDGTPLKDRKSTRLNSRHSFPTRRSSDLFCIGVPLQSLCPECGHHFSNVFYGGVYYVPVICRCCC